MHLTRLASGSAALLLAASLLGACGDKEGSANASSLSADVVPAAALTQQTFAPAVGDAIAAAGSAHLTMSGAIMGQEFTGEGDQVIAKMPADTQFAIRVKVLGMDVDLRLVDQVGYANLGSLTKGKFAEVDLTDPTHPLVAQFGDLAEQADVATQVRSVREAITGIDVSGAPETIDGVQTQPYTVTLDAKKLAESAGQDAASVPDTIPFTFFVGADNLPRRLVVGAPGQGLTLDFSDWGKAVKVEKPAKDDIADFDLSQLGAGAGV